MPQIPEIVATRVLRALDQLKSIRDRVASYVDVDTRFGGGGRYEAECYQALKAEYDSAHATIDQFSELARKNGIDPEQQLKAWGGVPIVGLTTRARDYLMEIN